MPSMKVKAKVHFARPIQTSHVPPTLVFWPVPLPPSWRCCSRDAIRLEMGTDRRDSLARGLKSAVPRSSTWAHVEHKSWCDLSPWPWWEKGAKRKGLERSKGRLEPPLQLFASAGASADSPGTRAPLCSLKVSGTSSWSSFSSWVCITLQFIAFFCFIPSVKAIWTVYKSGFRPHFPVDI